METKFQTYGFIQIHSLQWSTDADAVKILDVVLQKLLASKQNHADKRYQEALSLVREYLLFPMLDEEENETDEAITLLALHLGFKPEVQILTAEQQRAALYFSIHFSVKETPYICSDVDLDTYMQTQYPEFLNDGSQLRRREESLQLLNNGGFSRIRWEPSPVDQEEPKLAVFRLEQLVHTIETGDEQKLALLLDSNGGANSCWPISDSNREITISPLAVAAACNNAAIVAYLLERGATIDHNELLSPVLLSIDKDALAVFRIMHEKGAVTLHDNVSERVAVEIPMFAAECGAVEVMEYLLQNGVDVNMHGRPLPNTEGIRTLLRSAAIIYQNSPGFADSEEKKAVAITRMLLQHGAEIDQQREDGYTALMTAAYQGSLQLVRELLHAGANPSHIAKFDPLQYPQYPQIYQNRTAICEAYFSQHEDHHEVVEIVRTLHQQGASLDPQNNSLGFFYAIFTGNSELLAYLLQHCELPSLEHDIGHGCFGYIIAQCADQQILTILQKQIDWNWSSTADGTSLINIISRRGLQPFIAELLRTDTVTLGHQDKNGMNLLSAAIRGNQQELALWLLQKGCDPTIVDCDGESAITLACADHEEFYDFIEQLQEKYPQSDNAADEPEKVLFAAISDNDPLTVYRIISEGLVEQDDLYNGETPLIHAVRQNQAGIVHLLLQMAAYPEEQDENGYTAIDWAKKLDHTKILKNIERQHTLHRREDEDGNVSYTPRMGAMAQDVMKSIRGEKVDTGRLFWKSEEYITYTHKTEQQTNQHILDALLFGNNYIPATPLKQLLRMQRIEQHVGSLLYTSALLRCRNEPELELYYLIRFNLPIEEKLWDSLAKVATATFEEDKTVLQWAVENESVDVVRRICAEKSIDVNASVAWISRPLENAIRRNNPQIVRILLEAGANPNLPQRLTGLDEINRSGDKDTEAMLPILLGLAAGQWKIAPEIFDLLLQYKINVTAKYRSAEMAVFTTYANAARTGNAEIFQIIQKYVTDYPTDDTEIDALILSAISGRDETILATVFRHYANHPVISRNRDKYFEYITNKDITPDARSAVVELLQLPDEPGADTNAYPIMYLTFLGDDKSVSVLHKQGHRLDSISANITTPLMTAAKLRNVTMCKLLLELGAPVDQKVTDGDGEETTALQRLLAQSVFNEDDQSLLEQAQSTLQQQLTSALFQLHMMDDDDNESLIEQLEEKIEQNLLEIKTEIYETRAKEIGELFSLFTKHGATIQIEQDELISNALLTTALSANNIPGVNQLCAAKAGPKNQIEWYSLLLLVGMHPDVDGAEKELEKLYKNAIRGRYTLDFPGIIPNEIYKTLHELGQNAEIQLLPDTLLNNPEKTLSLYQLFRYWEEEDIPMHVARKLLAIHNSRIAKLGGGNSQQAPSLNVEKNHAQVKREEPPVAPSPPEKSFSEKVDTAVAYVQIAWILAILVVLIGIFIGVWVKTGSFLAAIIVLAIAAMVIGPLIPKGDQ